MNKHGHIPVVALKRLSPIRTKTPVVLQHVGRSELDEIRDAGKATRKAYSYTVTASQGPRNEEVRQLGASVPRNYPAATTTRVFVPETPDMQITFLSPRQMLCARICAAVLVPAIFLHALPRAYADELIDVATADATTSVGVAASEATPSSTEQPAAVLEPEIVATPPPESSPTAEVSVASAPPVSSEVLGVATETPLSSILPPVSSETVSEETSTTTVAPEIPEIPQTTEIPVPTETGTNPGIIERIADVLGVGGHDVGTTTAQNIDAVASEPTSTHEEASTTDSAVDDRATSTDETLSTTTGEQAAITPPPTTPNDEDVAAKAALHEEQLRQELRKQVEDEFMRGCISFESSGYYCLNTNAAASQEKVSAKTQSMVESTQGSGGNKEIFVVKNGERIALTTTNFDNAFPAQDISGEQFVWQGMKGGRWQIFYGTLSATGTPVVSQVTDSHDSNFNPKIDGDHLVWQGWVDDNWEIFLATKRDARSPFAGEHLPEGNALLTVGPAWSVERLTTNTTQDMFPALHGDIVTWQSREGDNWVVYAYSIATKKQTKLSSDGVKSENPGFAITWEEHDQEGHSRLMSYDLSTGAKKDLSDEAKKVAGDPFREKLPSPISQPNQATLPAGAGTGTSTPVRGDDDSGSGSNDLVSS